MAVTPFPLLSKSIPVRPALDARRQAPWLSSSYSDDVWVVADTRDQSRTNQIDFRFCLADGRLLTNVPNLLATVKEFSWWMRDPRFSKIDDSHTHKTMVANLLNMIHGFTLRNIWCFSHITPYDVERIVEDIRFGVDAVVKAAERVEELLLKLDPLQPAAAQLAVLAGDETAISPTAQLRDIPAGLVVAACNLPPTATRLPRVAQVIKALLRTEGTHVKPLHEPIALSELNNVTVQSVQRWLDPLEQLYAMRKHIEAESLTFKPFPMGAAKLAAIKGIGTSRTPIPPPRLVMHLLENAANWLLNEECRSNIRLLNFDQVLDLATACWIIIAAFTARRREEVNDLRQGSLRGDVHSGWWLEIYIEKTLQRKEWIPIPGMVALAVQTLEAISEDARAESGTDFLFQWRNQSGRVQKLNPAPRIDKFAAMVGVPDHAPQGKGPVPWHWHPHQFRRFFAVLYFYRFESGSIETLSHHLRHFSLEMTKRYVTTDPEVAAIWTDVEWGYMGHVARTIVSGERVVSGAAGERLKRIAERIYDGFRRRLLIASPTRIGASMKLIMQREGLVLTPKPWVTCTCPRTQAAATKAACRQQVESDASAVGPDFAQAGPAVCWTCPHAMIEGHRKPFVQIEAAHLKAAANNGLRKNTILSALEDTRLVTLEEALETRYASATPLSLALDCEEDGQ